MNGNLRCAALAGGASFLLVFFSVATAFITTPTQAQARVSAQFQLSQLFQRSGNLPFVNGEILVKTLSETTSHYNGGMADFASAKRMRPNTVFQLASISKIFTATAILQVRDDNLISLDDAVQRHLPSFPYSSITIRHLLAHTSGLPNLELYEEKVAAQKNLVISAKDTLEALNAWTKPLPFIPGTQFKYCNTNYVLLAAIVSRVSGKSFADYLKTRIFDPAQMRDSFALQTHQQLSAVAINHARPLMYNTVPINVRDVKVGNKFLMHRYQYELENLGQTQGDQNIFSTVSDLARFATALENHVILTAESFAEATTPMRLSSGAVYYENKESAVYAGRCSYGLGWEICEDPHKNSIVGHRGFSRGIHTFFALNLRKKQMLAMFENVESAQFEKKVAAVFAVLRNEQPIDIDWRLPAARYFGEALIKGDDIKAVLLYNRLRLEPKHYRDERDDLNLLGYDLLFNGHEPLALVVFRINILRNPEDANLYDSYGEALEKTGRIEDAISMYARAVELNPAADESQAALLRLRNKRLR
jgi:CubicO group peptidase (beta-lactamase class C family)